MGTKGTFSRNKIRKENSYFSQLRSIVETAFYGNNTEEIKTVEEAYRLAEQSFQTIVTDLPIKHPELLGLPDNAKVLVENGGETVGRTAAARRIYGMDKAEDEKLLPIIRQAVYAGKSKKRYKTSGYIGLDKDFMIKAHLSVPEGQENNLLSWLLNFQPETQAYNELYVGSAQIDQGDIYLYQDPEWSHPDYPLGLAYFDPDHNAAVILGLNYFGELKKGALSLAWNIANHTGYVACHGGQKRFDNNNSSYVASFFGLSGSGKSTLTHAKHENKYEVKVLHDDAFIISQKDGSSIALEPSYFDKTNDYPTDHPEVEYFLTVQNVGVTKDLEGKKVLVMEDIRNGNGRTVKSRYSTPNRVDKFEEATNAIYWIMKDDSLPPLIKLADPVLAAAFGATLATKRTSAERIEAGLDMNQLVIEPYANPFRLYPLSSDYDRFKNLFTQHKIDCYIINTGTFMENKIPKEVTLGIIEAVVDKTARFIPFGPFEHMSYMEIEGYSPELEKESYVDLVKDRIKMRVDYMSKANEAKGMDMLPEEALTAMMNLL